jgi:hypothetical protein
VKWVYKTIARHVATSAPVLAGAESIVAAVTSGLGTVTNKLSARDLRKHGYDLQPQEQVLLTQASVAYGMRRSHSDHLVLTDRSLVLIKKSASGTFKGLVTFPLDQLTKDHGRAAESHWVRSALEVHLVTGDETFRFDSEYRSDLSDWADSINNLCR